MPLQGGEVIGMDWMWYWVAVMLSVVVLIVQIVNDSREADDVRRRKDAFYRRRYPDEEER